MVVTNKMNGNPFYERETNAAEKEEIYENTNDGFVSSQEDSVLSGVLAAAAAAAVRRLTSNSYDEKEKADAVRVLEIVEEQRAFEKEKEQAQTVQTQTQKAASLDSRLSSATARSQEQKKNTERTCHDQHRGTARE